MKCAIDRIAVPESRKRAFSQEKARELAQSIREIGLLHPVVLTKNGTLISGLHRLEACKLLGWTEIDYMEKDYSDLDIELAEIDENLIRLELTVLERAEHLKRRKEIYEAKHPETRAYSSEKQRQRRKQEPDEKISPGFTIDTAAKLGVSPRTIQQEVQIAEKLDDEVKELLRDTSLADSKRDLLDLARKTPEEQKKTAAQLIVSSNSNEWYTPVQYVDAAREVMGGIDIDPATCERANETVKAKTIYTAETNGLNHDWPGRVWLNPPYGGLTGKFIARLIEQYREGITTEAITLVNSHATDTDWFQPLWDYTLCFTDHRINFIGPDGNKGNGSTHGSVFVYLGPRPEVFARVFSQFGAIVRRYSP